MQIDLGAYIAELLYQHDIVHVPGLGAFTKHYKPSTIDQVQGKIQAPSHTVEFNPNLGVDDGLLIDYVQQRDQLQYDAARAAVTDYVQQVHAAMERKEIVVFPKVGRLYRDFESNLQFLPDSTNFNTDTFGLPTVQFYPIVKRNVKPPAPVEERTTSRIGAAAFFQQHMTLILAVGVVTVALVIFLIFLKKYNGEADRDLSSLIPEDRINVRPGQNDSAATDKDSLSVSKFPMQPEDIQEEEATTDSDAATVAPDQRYAVIAIGLFREEANVNKLVKRLYEAGFEPYLEPLGASTRVGAQLTYDKPSELQRALQEVQATFTPDAFVLKKGRTRDVLQGN